MPPASLIVEAHHLPWLIDPLGLGIDGAWHVNGGKYPLGRTDESMRRAGGVDVDANRLPTHINSFD